MSVDETAADVTEMRERIFGLDRLTPLLDGSLVPYVNLDNAASTPPMNDVIDALHTFLPFYSSVHRGTGFKSRLSTSAYDQAHEIIGRFVGADPEFNTVIFGKNATEAINKLSYRFPLPSDSVVISTRMEHHSNDLPWRNKATVVHVQTTADGRLDEEDFDRQLAAHRGRVALVAVTAASNVTGFLQPVHRLARKTHEAGAQILVDAAQLAAHRRIDMKPQDDPEHLDFVAISAHKMYAPFGTGALIGSNDLFLQCGPEYTGGGTVDIVTEDEVYWAGLPDREEAGSPNVVGAITMAAAANALMEAGIDQIAAHEEELTEYTLERLSRVPGIKIYGESNPAAKHERLGVIPFNLEQIPHFLVAAILGYEGGIGVRSGCFCAHPYVVHLLNLSEEEQESWRTQILQGDHSNMPGMVRVSLGCYNNIEDIDKLVEMLERISQSDYRGDYVQEKGSGEFVPSGFTEPLADFFQFKSPRHP